jgi:diguanylate cyclase (GGDEF)-like protein/PAS domain S-box-containing protein
MTRRVTRVRPAEGSGHVTAGDSGAGTARHAFESLLVEFPTARLSAVTSDGSPVLVPAEVRLGEGHVLSGLAGLQSYLPQDRPAVIDIFERCLRDGHAFGDVRMLNDASVTITVHIFDTLSEYGVMLVAWVPSLTQDVVSAVSLDDHSQVRTRLARVYKTRTAEVLGIDTAITEILGWTAADMVGKRSLEFIHLDDQGIAIESWAVMVTEPDSPRRSRIRHLAKNGEWLWFDVVHNQAVWDGQPCFVADMIDVSEEMATQQALEAREQLLAQLAQALPLGVFQTDASNQFRYTNNCLFEMMGTVGAADFESLLRWVHPDDRDDLRHAMRNTINEGADTELSVRVESPDRAARVCQFTVRRLIEDVTTAAGAVGCVVDITEQTAMRRELEHRATFDPLTSCYNRASIMSILTTALDAARVASPPTHTAVLFVDLDRFKEINDRLGHHIGDEFLVATAARVRGSLRDGAVLGRLGGDEFLVVIPGLAAVTDAMAVAERVARVLRDDIALSIGIVPSQASVGLAVAESRDTSAEQLVKRADAAMYQAKARGDAVVATAAQPG